jgi:hypothetical protein
LSNSLPLYSHRLQSGHLEIFGSEMLLNRASTDSQLSVVFKVRETNNGALQVAGASDCFVSDGGYLWEGRGMSKRFFRARVKTFPQTRFGTVDLAEIAPPGS